MTQSANLVLSVFTSLHVLALLKGTRSLPQRLRTPQSERDQRNSEPLHSAVAATVLKPVLWRLLLQTGKAGVGAGYGGVSLL